MRDYHFICFIALTDKDEFQSSAGHFLQLTVNHSYSELTHPRLDFSGDDEDDGCFGGSIESQDRQKMFISLFATTSTAL